VGEASGKCTGSTGGGSCGRGSSSGSSSNLRCRSAVGSGSSHRSGFSRLISVAGMAISDIASGEVSDFKDYAWAAGRDTFVGAVSGKVLGPLGGKILKLGGKAAGMAGKAIYEGITSMAENAMTQGMDRKGFNLGEMLLDGVLGTATGGFLDSKLAGKIGKKFGDKFGPVLDKLISKSGFEGSWLKKGLDGVAKGFNDCVAKLNKIGSDIGKAFKNGVDTLSHQFNNMMAGMQKNLQFAFAGGVDVPPNKANQYNVTKSQKAAQDNYNKQAAEGKKELEEKLNNSTFAA
jgi:hypothetical protein